MEILDDSGAPKPRPNVDLEAAIDELIHQARVAACHIATYKPKNDLLSAVMTVELARSANEG